MPNNIPELFRYNFKRFKNKKIIYYNKNFFTYSQLLERVNNVSQLIRKLNLKNNSKICICMNKSIDQIAIILSALSLGHIVVPILPNLKTDNIRHILKNSNAKLIFVDNERYKEIPNEFKKITFKFIYSEILKKIIKSKTQTKQKSLKHIKIDKNQPALIIYSSGSTGMPKGIVVPHVNLVKGASIVAKYLGTKKTDKILGVLSFNFDYGLNQLWQTLLLGCRLYLYDFRLSKDYYNFIKLHKITALPLMPVIMTLSLNYYEKKSLKSVRYICTSGGPVEKEVLKKFNKIFPKAKIYLMYGLTEAFRSTYLDPKKILKKPNSIGSAIPSVKIHILNKINKDCKTEEVGELVHRGGCISLGYYRNKQKTSKVFRKISRFKNETVVFSGDLVKKDSEGDIYFIGRKDYLIKTAGYRVSPTEVEKQILKFKTINFTCVTGIYDKVRGQKIVCAYTTKNKKKINSVKLKSFCSNFLPTFMIPMEFYYFTKFPVTGNQGKINRVEIIKKLKEKK